MEPRIQYAKTSDGVNIAYATQGEGTPLLWLADFPWSHLQLELERQMPYGLSTLSNERMVVRFDARGLGLSDRDVEDLAIDARCLDVEAVANALGLEIFDLGGVGFSGPMAITFAVAHPERVSRLVLINSFSAPSRAFRDNPQSRALVGLASVDWEMFSENLGAITFGWGRPESRAAGEFIRASVDQEMFGKMGRVLNRENVTDILPQVKAETLVLQHRGFKIIKAESARELAAAIPDARIAMVEGSWSEGGEPLWQAVREFLNEGAPTAAAAPSPQSLSSGGFRTILFTDVEDSTALTDHMGDAAAREVLREHERITREALKAHGGSEVKTMGDGFMASFGSATKALECAVAIQRAFESPEATLGAQGLVPLRLEHSIKIRIGLNAGEPIAEDDDLFGTAVIVAARIAAQAHGGEILVSDVVRQLVAGKRFLFNDRGEHALKGFEDPVRVFEVRWAA